ncbi:MAG: DUF2254 domain-containing protein [Methanobacterium sp.]|uniref:DUF2254 family protein n=1 Tax=Methanobacterium sp. TaxID=2164 RepID=UPI003D650114|nr:DUF2254 domain-containing protein [Methanobacterium sp.]
MNDLNIFFEKTYKPKGIFLISIIVLILVFLLFSTNLDPLNLYSTILQSLAALLAIITAFTLIAVQLSSQTYSPRILKMFISLKNKTFWRLITLYLFSMFYCLILLIIQPKDAILELKDIIFVNIGFLLAFWCYMAIPYYIVATIDRLKPEEVIKDLNTEINPSLIKKISEYGNNKFIPQNFTDIDHIPPEDDPLIPLIDIIIGAIKEGHMHTAENGLRDLGNSFYKLINEGVITENNGKYTYKYLLEHLERVKVTAIKNNDSKTVRLLIQIIDKIGSSISKKVPECHTFSLEFLGEISSDIIGIGFENEALYLIKIYESLIIKYLNKINVKDRAPWHLYIYMVITDLNSIWISSTEKNEINIKKTLEFTLTNIFEKMIKTKFIEPLDNEIFFIMDFGIQSLEINPNMLDIIFKKLKYIYILLFTNYILKYDSDNNLAHSNALIINIVESLKNIGQESLDKNKQDLQIGPYIPIEEIIVLKNSIITKVIIILKDIALSYLNEDIYTKTAVKYHGKYQEIIMRIINYISVFSFELIDKKSNSVSDAMELLYSFIEPLSSNNKLKKLEIASEILETFNEMCFRLINNKSINKISECAEYLKKISQWADKHQMPIIKMNAIRYLGIIGLNLVKSEIFINDLRKVIIHLEEITFENIGNNSTKCVELSLNLLKKIGNEMVKEKVNKSELRSFHEFYITIQQELKKAKMHQLLEDYRKWVELLNKKLDDNEFYG